MKKLEGCTPLAAVNMGDSNVFKPLTGEDSIVVPIVIDENMTRAQLKQIFCQSQLPSVRDITSQKED